jgi:hypothetical protein
MAYAQLVLGILEVIVEDSSITGSLTAELEGNSGLRLCRQVRPPALMRTRSYPRD